MNQSMKKLEQLFFPHRVQKKYKSCLNRDGGVRNSTVSSYTHIYLSLYIYQIGAFEFRLVVRIWDS